MHPNISFLGAAGTVTGSRHLLQVGSYRLLLDCGLFQGVKTLRLRNWAPFPVRPDSIKAIVLSHAHLDHSGYIPLLVRNGFQGPIYCSAATRDLCEVLLTDSASLQEADAAYLNRHRLTRHDPALPLYTLADVERALKLLCPVHFGAPVKLKDGLSFRLFHAGHILGAAIVEVDIKGWRLVFSGDLGRYNDPLMPDPEPILEARYLIIESTYGDRTHDPGDVQATLSSIVRRTAERGGTLIIPSFAVGRSQLVLYHLAQLRQRGLMPKSLPIYLDSPMASAAASIYRSHASAQRLTRVQAHTAYDHVIFVQDQEQSKSLDSSPMPKIIVSASGMATGGRVLHHLKRYLPDARSTILLVGFQAAGTRGAVMLAGAKTIKIHGDYVPVRAELYNLSMLSAHADSDELLRWLRGFATAPRETFIVHGEPAASDALRLRIKDELGWSSHAAEQGEQAFLS